MDSTPSCESLNLPVCAGTQSVPRSHICQRFIDGILDLSYTSNSADCISNETTPLSCPSPSGILSSSSVDNGEVSISCELGSNVQFSSLSCYAGYSAQNNECSSSGIQYERMYFTLMQNQSSHGVEVSEIDLSHNVKYLGNLFTSLNSNIITMTANTTTGIFNRNYNNELIFLPGGNAPSTKEADGLSFLNAYRLVDDGMAQKVTFFPESYGNNKPLYKLSYFNSDIFTMFNPSTSQTEVWIVHGNTQSLLYSSAIVRANSFSVINNIVYFLAHNELSQTTLFSYNGGIVNSVALATSVTGTQAKIVSIRGRVFISDPTSLKLYELIENSIVDITPAGDSITNSFVFTDLNNNEFLALSYRNTATIGTEFAVYDGVNFHVFDIVPGTASSSPVLFTSFKGKLLMRGSVPFISGIQGGVELMVYDPNLNPSNLGLSANLTIYDLDTGNLNATINRGSSPSNFYIEPSGNTLFMTARRGDPAVTGNVQESIIFSYDGSGITPLEATSARHYNASTKVFTTRSDLKLYPNHNYMSEGMVLIGNKLYYRFTELNIGNELAVFDFSDQSLTVIDMYPANVANSGADSFYFNGSNLYFVASISAKASSGAIFKIDTSLSTIEIKRATNVYHNSQIPNFFGYFFDKLFLNSGDYGSEVFGESSKNKLYVYNDDLENIELFHGYQQGKVTDIADPSAVEFKGNIYYIGTSALTGNELMRTDGINPPEVVAEIAEGTANGVSGFLKVINPSGVVGEEKLIFRGFPVGGPAGLYVYNIPKRKPLDLAMGMNFGSSV